MNPTKTASLKPSFGAVLGPGISLLNKTGSWRSQRPVHRNKLPPCNATCPASNDIQQFIDLVTKGENKAALEILRKTNPSPAITGRVCYHPCESKCNRGQYDEALSINKLERFVGDFGLKQPFEKAPSKKRGEKIAIIGSGPAGLSCAYYLAKMGFPVTVFEALPVAGGMLAVSIPDYRLPKDIVSAAIKSVENLGVEIKTGSAVKKVEDLVSQGYKAVFVATGAHKSMKLGVAGEDKDAVFEALAFLRDAKLGKSVSIGKKVAVIGGGNVAVDAARVALRKDAKEVTIVYRRSRAEMPATVEEVEAAEAEGIKILFLAAPSRILGEKKVTGIECVKMQLGKPDASGRARPEPIKGSEFTVEADTVIAAIGQSADTSFAGKIKTAANGSIPVDEKTFATNINGIFAGGDVVTGPAMVADAIGAGRKAAQSIDYFVRGVKAPVEPEIKIAEFKDLNLAYAQPSTRAKTPELEVKYRKKTFDEVASGLTPKAARNEADRCLSCGVCSSCGNCWLFCPDACVINEKGEYEINYDYCKGCGVCANECPCSALTMVVEEK
jgi:putative selenate reductase YgfK subunit